MGSDRNGWIHVLHSGLTRCTRVLAFAIAEADPTFQGVRQPPPFQGVRQADHANCQE